jgi:hypothetical protein
MAKLIFKLNEDYNREAKEIEFTVPDDMNIYELKTVFCRLAAAMGYSPNSIENAFGDIDDVDTDDDDESFTDWITNITKDDY